MAFNSGFKRLRQGGQFDVHVTVHRDKFHIIKPRRFTNFTILVFEMKLYMFRTFDVRKSVLHHHTIQIN